MSVSIITINRNNIIGLKTTIASVLNQKYSDFEFIIVDGASSDGSSDLIAAISSDHRVKWVSEPDSGIYNAMNKGVRMSSKDYLLFLNSGDAFHDEFVLEHIVKELDDVDILIGRVNVIKNGKITGCSPLLKENDLGLFNMYLHGIPHQAAFIKRSLLIEHPYNESLKINSDWEFFVKAIVFEGANVKSAPIIISDYDGCGFSSTHMDLLLEERKSVFERMLPSRIVNDYCKVFPHSYEVKRIDWLLNHKFFYKIYRLVTSTGMRLLSRND